MTKPVLTIFVAEHCPPCVQARELARRIARQYTGILVKVVDINAERELIPEAVFAAPTYMLNDQIVSLGNPAWQQIQTWLNPAPPSTL